MTGAIGALLVPELLARGAAVHGLVREPSRLRAPWSGDIALTVGEVEDADAVRRAADGCDVAYYLVHGLDGPLATLTDRERAAAVAFRRGVADAGVRRIVYLGGLVDDDRLAFASEHLYARQQVGEELRRGPVPVTELRAGIVVTPGSASVELVLAAARLPVQVWGRWARSRVQPVAGDDLADLLVAVADDPRAAGRILDVGGPDVLTYEELVATVVELLGRTPARGVHVPYLPVELAASLAAARAGLSPRLTLALLQSVASDAVVHDETCRRWFGHLLSTPTRDALASLLAAGP